MKILTGKAVCRLGLLILFVFCMAPTCGDPVVVPAVDLTPPEATLVAYINGEQFIIPEEGQDFYAYPDITSIEFAAVGQDFESGIQEVSVVGSQSWHCGRNCTSLICHPYVQYREISFAETDVHYVGTGETAYTGMWEAIEVRHSPPTCSSSSYPDLLAADIYVWGVVTNQKGLESTSPTAHLRLYPPPSCPASAECGFVPDGFGREIFCGNCVYFEECVDGRCEAI